MNKNHRKEGRQASRQGGRKGGNRLTRLQILDFKFNWLTMFKDKIENLGEITEILKNHTTKNSRNKKIK